MFFSKFTFEFQTRQGCQNTRFSEFSSLFSFAICAITKHQNGFISKIFPFIFHALLSFSNKLGDLGRLLTKQGHGQVTLLLLRHLFLLVDPLVPLAASSVLVAFGADQVVEGPLSAPQLDLLFAKLVMASLADNFVDDPVGVPSADPNLPEP